MSLQLNGIIKWGPIILIVICSLLLQVQSPFDIQNLLCFVLCNTVSFQETNLYNNSFYLSLPLSVSLSLSVMNVLYCLQCDHATLPAFQIELFCRIRIKI
jgi:hypothetical protein